jgi:hypothetical protein
MEDGMHGKAGGRRSLVELRAEIQELKLALDEVVPHRECLAWDRLRCDELAAFKPWLRLPSAARGTVSGPEDSPVQAGVDRVVRAVDSTTNGVPVRAADVVLLGEVAGSGCRTPRAGPPRERADDSADQAVVSGARRDRWSS